MGDLLDKDLNCAIAAAMKGTEVPNPRRSSACDSGMRMLRPRALIRAVVGVAT